MATRAPSMKVADAVRRDLRELGFRSPDLATSGLAAAALALARRIDNPKVSATATSMCTKALQDAMRELRELAPAAERKDRVDDLSARRSARHAGSA